VSGLAEPQKADFERASRELRQSALGLAQAWQALMRAGWSSAQLRPLLLALRQLIKGCDRLRLASLRKRANDLELMLVPFISGLGVMADGINSANGVLKPQPEQARGIEAAVSALTSSVLAVDLGPSLPAFLLANAANDAAPVLLPQAAAAPVQPASPLLKAPIKALVARLSDANTVVVLRADADLAAGLIDALKERGHRILELSTTQALELLLVQTMPGAVIADARFLNGISRQLSALKARPGTAEVDAAVVVISDRRDLGRRLLANRNGAVGYFEEPVDVLEVSAALALKTPKVATLAAHRALLCTHNQVFSEDCARWLMSVNVATRIEHNAIGALAACLDYAPEVLLVDASVKQDEALRLVTELRRHARHAHLPVVLFAGLNSLAQRERAIAAGADEYLIEPVKQRHLLSVVTARLERLGHLRQTGASPKNPSGMLSRAEFLAEYARQPELALIFLLIDQTEALGASYPVSAFDQLDAGIAALLRPRLKSKELLAYFQDGQYLLAVRTSAEEKSAESQLDELAEKLRRSVQAARIDLGNGPERLTASVAWIRPGSEHLAQTKGLDDHKIGEHAVHLARHAARSLKENGGNQVRASSTVELVNPSNKSARADVPTALTLQPLLCASGKLQGQYFAHFWWQGADAGITGYAQAAAQARAAGHIDEFDRRMLLAALNRRSEELKRGRQVRLLVQIGVESVLDGGLCLWLTQQLNTLKLSGSGLSLYTEVAVAHSHPSAWQQRLSELHSLGMRVGLSLDSIAVSPVRRDLIAVSPVRRDLIAVSPVRRDLIDTTQQTMLASLHYDFAILPGGCYERSGDDPNDASPFDTEWLQLLRRVRDRGSVSIVPGIRSRVELDQLKSLRVDFVSSDVLAPATDSADFDFARFARC
jgi:DNA-binding response OmpR family regulator